MSQHQSNNEDDASLAMAFFTPSAPSTPGSHTALFTLVEHTCTHRLVDQKPPQIMPDCACK